MIRLGMVVLFMLAATTTVQARDDYSIGTGFEYTTGKYGGATSTDILYIPVIGKYQSDKLTLKLTVPYIRVTGSGGVVPNVGQVGQVGASKTTQSGMGDIIVSAAYNVHATSRHLVDVVGKVKLATADRGKGLGTGENDIYGQVDFYQLDGENTFFETIGYKMMGQPAGLALRDVMYGSIGVSHKISNVNSAGLMLDMAQSSNANRADRRELIAFMTQKLSPDLKLQFNLIKGFSNNSADFGAGMIITKAL